MTASEHSDRQVGVDLRRSVADGLAASDNDAPAGAGLFVDDELPVVRVYAIAFAGLDRVMRNVQHVQHAARRIGQRSQGVQGVRFDLRLGWLPAPDEGDDAVAMTYLPARRVIDRS